jgi:hypothetical protein
MSDPVIRLNAALEGRYAIERELGEGGMATVYLAKDLKHNRNVALKVMKPELTAVVGAERFLAEIETTANLTQLFPAHNTPAVDPSRLIELQEAFAGVRDGTLQGTPEGDDGDMVRYEAGAFSLLLRAGG